MSENLFQKAKSGDADAFTTLCEPYEGMVYRHCLQLLRNPADAEDAAQEAMLRAYRAMPRFRENSGVATWLYRIAHNVCLDWLRRPCARRENASLNALREQGFDPPDNRPTPEGRYLAFCDRERLEAAVARLPYDQQTLLSLRYGDNLSYEELSLALSLNPGTVKSRLNRARERLRALLGDFHAEGNL